MREGYVCLEPIRQLHAFAFLKEATNSAKNVEEEKTKALGSGAALALNLHPSLLRS
jgi:hypothetical protein